MSFELYKSPEMWHSGAPYSPAVRFGDLIFVSGAVPVDPVTGETVAGGIEEQTRRTLLNIELTLLAAGSSLDRLIKTTVFLTDSKLAPLMNESYAEVLAGHMPARSTVQVGPLARPEFLIEIEAIAIARAAT